MGILPHKKQVYLNELKHNHARPFFPRSLESDSYNHVTATFYLLAERKLRRLHEQANAAAQDQSNQDDTDEGNNKTQLAPLALSPRLVNE